MKTKILITLLFISATIFAQEFKSPVEYLTYIGKEQENIAKSMWKYTTAVAHSKNARRIDNTRKQLISTIDAANEKVKNLKDGYNGDTEFRDQVLDYLRISKIDINEEYDKIINMQEISEQSYDDMEAYITARDLINKKIDAEHEKVKNAQLEFAKKYKITLTQNESELGKKMKLSNEVFDYHTALYLIFFKLNYTDLKLNKAIEDKDLGAIQQNTIAINQYITEGLDKLKNIQPYNKDASLLEETKASLDYFKNKADKFVPQIVNYIMLEDKFKNAKNAINSKSQADRTKEEIDNYNSLVKQINKEIENYNKINDADFQEKNNLINQWNSTGDNFISAHVPN